MRLDLRNASDRCDRCGDPARERPRSALTGRSLCPGCSSREREAVVSMQIQGALLAGLEAGGQPGHPPHISAADVRAALWRLKAHRALQRIAPSELAVRKLN